MKLKRQKDVRHLSSLSRQNDRGTIIVLTAFVMVTLVTLVSLVINTSYARVIRAEFQTAADAAALAGATRMCSSNLCYIAARESAIEILKQHALRGSLGEPVLANISASDQGPQWADDTLHITIQRGRWWPGGMPPIFDGTPVFEEIDLLPDGEGSDGGTAAWQAK